MNSRFCPSRSSEEIDEFFDSMKKCFDDVDQALADENASIPLDYLESRLEDQFQIVNAIAIAIQDNASSDLNPGGGGGEGIDISYALFPDVQAHVVRQKCCLLLEFYNT